MSDDDEDEAKDVAPVNGDSNSDLYVGHRTKSLIFAVWSDLFQRAYKIITLNTQVPARELCQSVSADAAFFCYYGAVNN